ncbi:MAG: hypothetical protein P1U44_14370 [Vicingaceae bacterium]|nr:hypothetical protein [Vicingaceae bacterium]
MATFNELTKEEKTKITHAKYAYLGVGFVLGMFSIMFYDLYLTAKNQ